MSDVTPAPHIPAQAGSPAVATVVRGPVSGSGADVRVVARAQKAQKVSVIAAALTVVVFTLVALTLRGKTESGLSYFHPQDQIAMIVLGLVAAAGILVFTRPRIVADRSGIRVRNLLGWMDVPWDLVTAVRFDRGNPWAAIDLRDDDVISVMAIQAADKGYAVAAVRALRALLVASREPAE